MDSIFLHQKANELVQSAGSRDLRTIAKTVGMNITEMPFDAISGFFTFKWDLYQVVIKCCAGQADQADGMRLCTEPLC